MTRKTIEITTKKRAESALIDSLFKPINGHTLVKSKWCAGKYANSGKGREIEVTEDVQAVWGERRSDRDGAYYTLYCYHATNKDGY